MDFLNALLNYGVQYILMLVLAGVSCFLGIRLRIKKNEKAKNKEQ